MKLYDFSVFVQRRDAKKAAQDVADAVAHLDQPGAVIVLKKRMSIWLDLHREITKRSA